MMTLPTTAGLPPSAARFVAVRIAARRGGRDGDGANVPLTSVTVAGDNNAIGGSVNGMNLWASSGPSPIYQNYTVAIDAGAAGRLSGLSFNPSTSLKFHSITAPQITTVPRGMVNVTWAPSGASSNDIDINRNSSQSATNQSPDGGSRMVNLSTAATDERIRVKRIVSAPIVGASPASHLDLSYRAGMRNLVIQ